MAFNPRSILYTFDSPVTYKGLILYPVKLKDYIMLQYLSSCLLLDKNSISDVKIISMTYMEYLFSISNNENNLISLFDGLLRLVLGKAEEKNFDIIYVTNEKGKPFFKIGETIYNSDDFDVLREIISEQNLIELIDDKIQKNVRDEIEKARRFKEKLNNSKVASFEDQIVALSLYSGWSLETIYNLTIRKFKKAVTRANHMIHAQIYLTASMSGFVTFKDKSILRGWLADLDNDDRNSDVTIDLESVQNKINFTDAKNNS